MFLHNSIPSKAVSLRKNTSKAEPLQELENILGFHKGRLSKGIVVAALLQIPSKPQFELLGYTQVAGHKINSDTFKG
jgi:hypothetical protein